MDIRDEDGMKLTSYLSAEYKGPFAWEILRARRNRQNFQNTLNTTIMSSSTLKNVYSIDYREKFINCLMMYLLVDNGLKGEENMKQTAAVTGKMTVYGGGFDVNF